MAVRQGKARSSSVQSVDRAVRVLTTLVENVYPMGVVELAGRLRLSTTSVHRMLSTLVSLGWVEQSQRTSRYRPGTTMLGVGAAGLITHPIVQNGKHFLRRLSDLTGFDSYLSTCIGARVVYLARADGSNGFGSEFDPGVSFPAHASADGKLLLSYMSRAERQRMFCDGLHRYTPFTITDPEAFEVEMAEIQARGYALDHGERIIQGHSMAVPVMGSEGKPVLAMMSCSHMELTPQFVESLSQQMLAVAQDMSCQLAVMGDTPKVSVGLARYNLD